jgi:hypothetical protein
MKPERGPVSKQARQLRLALDAYGLASEHRDQIIPAMIERMVWNVQFWSQRRAEPQAHEVSVSEARVERIIADTRAEKAYVQLHEAIFARALS